MLSAVRSRSDSQSACAIFEGILKIVRQGGIKIRRDIDFALHRARLANRFEISHSNQHGSGFPSVRNENFFSPGYGFD